MRSLLVILLCTVLIVMGQSAADTAQTEKAPRPDKLWDSSSRTSTWFPPNGDTVMDAIEIFALPYVDTDTTCRYLDDYDEECPYADSTSPDVVYKFTPGTAMTVDLDLCGSDYDTKIYVYDSSLNLIACNDDYYPLGDPCGDYVSYLDAVPLNTGQTYFIVVDGYGGQCGYYHFEMVGHCNFGCSAHDIAEGEPPLVYDYDDYYNGGCESQIPSLYQDLGRANGRTVICGEGGWFQRPGPLNRRDTDYFKVVIGPSGYINTWIDAEYAISLVRLPFRDCPFDTSDWMQSTMGGPCSPSEILTITGAPQDTVLLFVVAWGLVSPEGPHDQLPFRYRMTIEDPTSVYLRPGPPNATGMGHSLMDAWLWGGASVSVQIPVYFGTAGVPRERFRLSTNLDGVCWSDDYGNIAEHATGVHGWTVFRNWLSGGHYTNPAAGERTVVEYRPYPSSTGIPLPGHVYDIRFNSSDNNGDGVVNLSDIVLFTQDLNAYHYRSDYNWDGLVNLSDIARMTSSIGLNYPCSIALNRPVPPEAPTVGAIGIYFDEHGTQRTAAVDAGESQMAHVVVQGMEESALVGGWDFEVATSRNVVVDEWILAEKTHNFAEPPTFLVGCADDEVVCDGGVATLMSVRFHVIDAEPGWLDIITPERRPGGVPLVALGREDVALFAPIPAGYVAGHRLALVNDAFSDAGLVAPNAMPLDLHAAPNPFNPATDIKFNLPREGTVRVDVYDIDGRRVRTLMEESLTAGPQTVHWDGNDAFGAPTASGVYFIRLTLDNELLGPTLKTSLVK